MKRKKTRFGNVREKASPTEAETLHPSRPFDDISNIPCAHAEGQRPNDAIENNELRPFLFHSTQGDLIHEPHIVEIKTEVRDEVAIGWA